MKKQINKPKYTVPELARIIGVNSQTLYLRIKKSENKPDSGFRSASAAPSPVFWTKLANKSGAARADRYDKDSFIEWHQREWIDSGRAYNKEVTE